MNLHTSLTVFMISLLAFCGGCCCGPPHAGIGACGGVGCCEGGSSSDFDAETAESFPGDGCDNCCEDRCESCCEDPCGDCCGTGKNNFSGVLCGLKPGKKLYKLLRHWKPHRYCGNGCGEKYWCAWLSDPPDYCDPCNQTGHWIGSACCRTNFWKNLLHRPFSHWRCDKYGYCGDDCSAGCCNAGLDDRVYHGYGESDTWTVPPSNESEADDGSDDILPAPVEEAQYSRQASHQIVNHRKQPRHHYR